MKSTKSQPLLILCLFAFQLKAQTDNSRLSPNLMQILHEEEMVLNTGPFNYTAQIGKRLPILNLLIKVNNGFDESSLIKSGAVVGTKAGNIWTVSVPKENLKDIIDIKGIEYMELGQKVAMQMDSARYFTHVDSVIKGIGLPMPLSGKGVVIGIIDGGFDYTNPAFYDTTYSKLRITKAWVQNIPGSPPSGYTYGAEFKDTASLLQKKFDFDNSGSHGSEVAGIAAGSGIGSKNARAGRGIAYESELVLVSVPLTVQDWREVNMATIIDGINYIFSYAQSKGKPAVINISLGSIVGARDGKSLFAQACDNLTGPGKIIVLSAGNNGGAKNHIGKKFTFSDTALNTLVSIEKYNNGDRRNYIDAWGDSLKSFCLQFGMYKNGTVINNSTIYCMDNSTKNLFIVGSDNDTCYITLTTKTQEYNKKPHATIDILSKSKDTLCLSTFSKSGSVHMWQEYFDESWVTIWGNFLGNNSWASEGDDNYTIGEMGCTKSAITVGATVSRVFWKDIQNRPWYIPQNKQQGELAYYSSRGPTLDNRTKPDITAPGGMINSSANSFDAEAIQGGTSAPFLVSKYTSPKNGRNYYYATGQGTSFASPMVAGIVALMLQVNPNLEPERIKLILQETAIKDNFTTQSPDAAKWGAGKINAYAAIKETIRWAGTTAIPKNETTITVYPNPSQGKFTLGYESLNSGYFFVEVSNSLGEVIKNNTWQLSKGKNQMEMNIDEIKKGLYFISITGQGGQIVKKLILN
jgi:subtilisin family serine protease